MNKFISYFMLCPFILLIFSSPSLALSPDMIKFVNESKDKIRKIDMPETRQVGGALVYTFKDKKAFFLFGKESSSEPRLLNNWCSLVGRREQKDKSLLETILRETEEEAAGLYRFPNNLIDDSTTYSFFKNFKSKGDKGYLFIYVIEPLSRESLNSAAESHSNQNYKEKSDYLWITFPSDGPLSRNIEVIDIEGQNHNILLRESFLEELNSKEFQAILSDISENAAKL